MKTADHPGLFHTAQRLTAGQVVDGLITGKITLDEATCDCRRCLDALESVLGRYKSSPDPTRKAKAAAIEAKLAELLNHDQHEIEPHEPEVLEEPDLDFPSIE